MVIVAILVSLLGILWMLIHLRKGQKAINKEITYLYTAIADRATRVSLESFKEDTREEIKVLADDISDLDSRIDDVQLDLDRVDYRVDDIDRDVNELETNLDALESRLEEDDSAEE